MPEITVKCVLCYCLLLTFLNAFPGSHSFLRHSRRKKFSCRQTRQRSKNSYRPILAHINATERKRAKRPPWAIRSFLIRKSRPAPADCSIKPLTLRGIHCEADAYSPSGIFHKLFAEFLAPSGGVFLSKSQARLIPALVMTVRAFFIVWLTDHDH